MLKFRRKHDAQGCTWTEIFPGQIGSGLHEDTDYLLSTENQCDVRVFVDDVELTCCSESLFSWRPCFYAGRVNVDVLKNNEISTRYFLDVSPSKSKSGQSQFDDMVAEIRDYDQTLLGGTVAATIEFGHQVGIGKFANDILLTRLREHGPIFLTALEAIARAPHRSLKAESKVLPLSRIRVLHPTALRDRRLVAIVTGQSVSEEDFDSIQLTSSTSTPTFDTPANRALLALLKRFRAAVARTQEVVQNLKLEAPQDEQMTRVKRRLADLESLSCRTHRLLVCSTFSEVTSGETSAAGLTQVAAQPKYSRAYRIGHRSMSIAVEGGETQDHLHAPPSWGIYETWCYLLVLKSIVEITGVLGLTSKPRAASAERSTSFTISDGSSLEVLFQATFPSLKAAGSRSGWSLSKERRPDIVLIQTVHGKEQMLVFDAKWRHGREYILDAMESGHIYHDALRLGFEPPTHCLLLLPGSTCVQELEQDDYITSHGVGAFSSISIGMAGPDRLKQWLKKWLAAS
ncbi:restriction endonuclease-like protein [Paucibacter sp. B2R-40]|uniref:restriction endonuclease-like protein n=1 Tax=Paucibacter sp. B2R-40 TaxID=2893554 RepID=UPI0021E4CAC9|nr:restriction endonuclease-like protein [Paucibacter sp. B2R-40]MCV2355392.1 restriction endonuclease-like protein [Paucibacter sp. B2R-40]